MHNYRARLSLVTVLALLALVGCDGTGGDVECDLLGVSSHTKSVIFQDNQLVDVARLVLEQKVSSYETGDCTSPSSSNDGVRLLVQNLTTCTIDLDFSLSVFEGQDGWTVLRKSHVAKGVTEDLGIIHRAATPRVDNAQAILTGTAVRSNCT